MEPESTTKRLWRLARSGHAEAFDELFGLHTERLLVFVRIRLGGALRGKLDPEDVLQEAYLAAVRRFDEFDYSDDGAFTRWMCRIIENRLRDGHDHFRALKRQAVPVPKSFPTGPVSALVRAESCQQLEAALSRLSDEHREVLLLRYFQGLNSEQAGQRMRRSAGAIRNLTARALVELGKQLRTAEDIGP